MTVTLCNFETNHGRWYYLIKKENTIHILYSNSGVVKWAYQEVLAVLLDDIWLVLRGNGQFRANLRGCIALTSISNS